MPLPDEDELELEDEDELLEDELDDDELLDDELLEDELLLELDEELDEDELPEPDEEVDEPSIVPQADDIPALCHCASVKLTHLFEVLPLLEIRTTLAAVSAKSFVCSAVVVPVLVALFTRVVKLTPPSFDTCTL